MNSSQSPHLQKRSPSLLTGRKSLLKNHQPRRRVRRRLQNSSQRITSGLCLTASQRTCHSCTSAAKV